MTGLYLPDNGCRPADHFGTAVDDQAVDDAHVPEPPEQPADGAGTAGEDQGNPELEADRDYLLQLWDRVQAYGEQARAPNLVHHELSPVLRTVRDMFTHAISEVWIDDEESFQEVLDFLEQSDPAQARQQQEKRHPGDPGSPSRLP